jgi:polysaccharide biosynthesis transport protein
MLQMQDQQDVSSQDEGAGGISQLYDSIAAAIGAIRLFLRRHWKINCAASVPFVALGVIIFMMTPVKYVATSTILLDKPRLHLFQQQTVVSDPAIETHAAVEGQLEVMKSDAIAEQVIKKLRLDEDPDFFVPSRTNGLLVRLGLRASTPITQEQRERRYLELFARQRNIRRLGASFAFEVSFQSHSAAQAAAVANAIVEAYTSDMSASRRNASRNASDWLLERLGELRTQASESEKAVVDFSSQNGIVEAGGKLIFGQQITELSSQLTTARSQLFEASSRLSRALAAVLEFATPTANPTVAEITNTPLTMKLIERYSEFANREAEYSKRFGVKHDVTVKLRQSLEEMRTGILNELTRQTRSLRSEKEILEKRVADIGAELKSSIDEKRRADLAQVKLHELESRAQSYRTLYDGLLRRQSETVLQEEQPITGARILSLAAPPQNKDNKKLLMVSLGVALGGLVLGFAVSIAKDIKDRTFRTSNDIARKLSAGFTAMIPIWRPEPSSSPGEEIAFFRDESVRPGDIYHSSGPASAVVDSPASAFADAIGRVKYSLIAQARDTDCQVLAMTSVLGNEGTSTLAAGLAQSLARSGRSVILVDCDMRNPELTRGFAPHATAGLQDLLLGQAKLEDVVLRDPKSGFAFLPGIVGQLRALPEEFLESAALTALIRELRKRYRYIILDLPPIVPILDVVMMDRLINSYILVARWGTTRTDVVADALDRYPQVRDRLMGIILNMVDFKRLNEYDQRTADFHDEKRYSHYLLSGPLARHQGIRLLPPATEMDEPPR